MSIEALGLPEGSDHLRERTDSPVVLVPHDERWRPLFDEERARIQRVLGDRLVHIAHVGSTAVAGIAAKPILDIAATIRSLDEAATCVEPLASVGYVYIPEMEQDLPQRRYFRKDGRPGVCTHHLHVYGEGHPDFRDYLVFREYLQRNPEAAREYEELKQKLASTVGRADYTKGKGPFIEAILERARDELGSFD